MRSNSSMWIIGGVVLGLIVLYFGSRLASRTTDEAGNGDGMFKQMLPAEAKNLLEAQRANPDFVILDVRTAAEFQAGHLAGAQNIDFYAPTFATEIAKLDKTKTYFVYCRSGNRSGKTLQLMERLRFTQASHLQGGIVGWHNAGLPVVTPAAK